MEEPDELDFGLMRLSARVLTLLVVSWGLRPLRAAGVSAAGRRGGLTNPESLL